MLEKSNYNYQNPKVIEFIGHDENICIIKRISEELLVSGDVCGQLIIWDLKNGDPLFGMTGDQWENCNAPINGIEITSDSKNIITWQENPSMGFRIWNASDGRLTYHLWDCFRIDHVWMLDNDRLLAYSFEAFDEPSIYRLGVFSIKEGKLLWSIERQNEDCYDINFKTVSHSTFITSVGNETILWNTENCKPLYYLSTELKSSYRVSTSGMILVLNSEKLILLDGLTGKLIGKFDGKGILGADFFENSIVFFNKSSIFTWDGQNKPLKIISVTKGKIKRFSDITIFPDGFTWCQSYDITNNVINGSTLYVNNIITPLKKTIEINDSFVRIMEFSAIFENVEPCPNIVGVITSSLKLYDTSAKLLWEKSLTEIHLDTLTNLLVIDEQQVLTSHNNGSVLLWEKNKSEPTVLCQSQCKNIQFWGYVSPGEVVIGDQNGLCVFTNLYNEEKPLTYYNLTKPISSGEEFFRTGATLIAQEESQILFWAPWATKKPIVLYSGENFKGTVLDDKYITFTSSNSNDFIIVSLMNNSL